MKRLTPAHDEWLPTVRKIAAHQYYRLGSLTRLLTIDVDDLFQVGMVGFLEAAPDVFDYIVVGNPN